MWSLYEAAQLRIHGEEILEEAHEFTYNNLKSITNQLSPSLADQINQSLVQPLHKAIPRMRARSYMFFYEEDPSSHDKVLLNLAKLDFNMLQKLYQKEVGVAVRWWEKSEFARKVPYVRHRIAELFFWPLAMTSEPQYSTLREEIIKVTQWMTIVDDTFDVYGTIEELELFTLAIQRWDIRCIASLPECYKEIFNSTVELFDEIIDLSSVVGGESNLVRQCVKQTLLNFVQGYMTQAKWIHEGYIPTYEEYKANGVFSSGYQFVASLFIALGGFATKEMLDWVCNVPVMVKASGLVLRLTNDLGSRKIEQQRGPIASAVECCMKQYGFSEKEAYEFVKNDINNCWKDMNEEYLRLIKDIPKPVLDCIVNLASICEFLYGNYEDKFTDCALLKHHIVALLLDPVVV
ncbi:hypothetical protein PIB30_046052 [Stylosanthes scabra]|uniref:Terpene synthase metal-binding domain-containing protein n=1 Tax=Stylosanthes scabra TaxID=79078 RepID=A0ABU6RGZ3_9FABA|nr:hypothetical protein [Stylosanthes scabra]